MGYPSIRDDIRKSNNSLITDLSMTIILNISTLLKIPVRHLKGEDFPAAETMRRKLTSRRWYTDQQNYLLGTSPRNFGGRLNVDELAHAQIERLRKFLPTEDDVTLIVLKGHLLAEEVLDELIELRCVEPQHIENTRISFAIKVRLARALCGDIVWQGSWPLLEKLNQLRNGLAHNLDSPKLLRLVSAFLTERRAQAPLIHDAETDPTDPTEMIRRLRSDVSMLVSQLIAGAIMIRDLKRTDGDKTRGQS